MNLNKNIFYGLQGFLAIVIIIVLQNLLIDNMGDAIWPIQDSFGNKNIEEDWQFTFLFSGAVFFRC